MKSQKVQNQSIGQNKKTYLRNYLSALSIKDMSASSLDDFFSGVFKSIGVEINSTYKISEIIDIFHKKNIKIISVCGIGCDFDVPSKIKDLIGENNTSKEVFGILLYSDEDKRKDFYKVVEHLNDSYKLTRAKVLPTFTELNSKLSVKDRYNILIFGDSPDGSSVNVPVISVELS